MKNKKFSIEVIEKGRLSKKESLETTGGGITCIPSYHTLCAVYTNCKPSVYGYTDEDGKFGTMCKTPTEPTYLMCVVDPDVHNDPKY